MTDCYMCCKCMFDDCFLDAGTIGPVEDARKKESSEGMPVSRRKPNSNFITGSLANVYQDGGD